MTVLFLVLWAAILFFILRYAGRRYFREPFRAESAALVGAFAFVIGGILPRPIAPPAVVSPHDVSSECVHLQSPLVANLYGSIDDLMLAGAPPGSKPVAADGRISRSLSYNLDGWAADAGPEHPAIGTCLLVDGKLLAQAISTYGYARPDIGSSYDSTLVPSGYRIQIPPNAMLPGTHHLRVIAVIDSTHAGTLRRELGDRTVVVY